MGRVSGPPSPAGPRVSGGPRSVLAHVYWVLRTRSRYEEEWREVRSVKQRKEKKGGRADMRDSNAVVTRRTDRKRLGGPRGPKESECGGAQ